MHSSLKVREKGQQKKCNLFCDLAAKRVEWQCCLFITHEKKNVEKLGTLVSCKTGLNVGRLKHVTSLFNLF